MYPIFSHLLVLTHKHVGQPSDPFFPSFTLYLQVFLHISVTSHLGGVGLGADVVVIRVLGVVTGTGSCVINLIP